MKLLASGMPSRDVAKDLGRPSIRYTAGRHRRSTLNVLYFPFSETTPSSFAVAKSGAPLDLIPGQLHADQIKGVGDTFFFLGSLLEKIVADPFDSLGYSDTQRTAALLKGVGGKRLTYR